jgi:GNAT superfamily N-acetyltransferase
MHVTIRKAEKADMQAVLDLIKELALFERAPGEVTNTVEKMLEDGFGKKPVFYCDVAEVNNVIRGIAVYFIKYSTWKGKCVYLDDIVVTESYRKQGIGRLLFENVMRFAKEINAEQLHWQVLDWNTPAIEFYKKYNASFDDEWVNCRLSRQQLMQTAIDESI